MSRMVRSVSPTDLAQKAFVRGLADDTDEDGLRRAFSKFGEVVEVHIAKDRDTNAPRGFAFITFNSSTDCNKACTTMDGKEFHGKVLHVELAAHFKSAAGGRGGFRGSRGRSGFRGGRGRGAPRSPLRDTSYRRGGGSSRGSWRGGSSGRGDYRSYGSRTSDSFYSSEERFRSSVEREPPRDYGSRYDSEYRSMRPERGDYPPMRDYPSYRPRDYPGADRDYGPPPREREYPGYYSPPRDYPPSDRDYAPSRARDYLSAGRDYPLSRADDFDMAARRYSSRDYDFPPGNGFYDSHPPRRDYGPSPRDYGSAGRYDSYEGGARSEYKSRGSFSGRGSRDMDYARGMPPRRLPRDGDRPAGMRRQARSPDGPPSKKMKMGEPMHRSPREGGGSAGRRY